MPDADSSVWEAGAANSGKEVIYCNKGNAFYVCYVQQRLEDSSFRLAAAYRCQQLLDISHPQRLLPQTSPSERDHVNTYSFFKLQVILSNFAIWLPFLS